MSEIAFQSAEEAWFWAVNCEKAKCEGAKIAANMGFPLRPCNVLDVFIVIKRLYEEKKINYQHIMTLKFFGIRGLRPNRDIRPAKGCPGRDERKAYKLWTEAMDLMEIELRKKGLINHD